MGDTATDTVTAHASDDELNDTSASGSASVTFDDVLPTLPVTHTADPDRHNDPNGKTVGTGGHPHSHANNESAPLAATDSTTTTTTRRHA